ncbi:ABC transporter substrate-binding protein [Marinimicrococcus flavescens]|uniref:ABC transporter substrate-binding protein n=1 Tax=Marinimicrococcus flavescens TaxID=3031815 RepID=A0AAP3V0U4_9PROT|nr:ABC transporter substrate-binding protein [Marinimicrococcus flavescens]
MRKLKMGMLLLGAAALALAAGPREMLAATPADTLVMAKNIDDIISLDPAEVFEFSGGEVIANVYDRVMTYEAENPSVLTGGVAESWKAGDDGKTITIKIRPGLKFHSGNPVTAEDVAFSLQRVVKLDKSPAFILTQLGWTAGNVEEMVKATGPQTLVLTTNGEFGPSFVLNCLSAGVGSVLDKKTVMAHAEGDDLGHAWLKSHSAGSGPFALRAWRANEAVTLDAFGDYHLGVPKMKRVAIRHIPETSAQRLLLEKADVDIARNLSPDQIAGLEGEEAILVETHPKAALHYLGLNQKDERLANPKVRQALRWLVDYEGMANSFLEGSFKVHQAFWPSGFPGSVDTTPFRLDVAKAKELLAEAGYPDGFEVTLDVSNSWPSANMAEAIQQTMSQAGIKVSLQPAEGKQVLTKYRARNHQMVLLYWSPDYMDPHSNADSFARNPDNSDDAKSKPLAWRNAWDIPEITQATNRAAREQDAEKRLEMYRDLQRRLQEDGPFIILFQALEQVARRSNVKGFVSGPTFDTVYYRLVTK